MASWTWSRVDTVQGLTAIKSDMTLTWKMKLGKGLTEKTDKTEPFERDGG